MPDNLTLRLACMQDYKAFYKEEIKYREEFFYPPFCDIINIIISSSDEEEARTAASVIAMKLKTALRTDEECILYEPSKAPFTRFRTDTVTAFGSNAAPMTV